MLEYKFYLAGELRGETYYDLNNPYDGELIAKVARASKRDLEEAIDRAEEGLKISRSYSVVEKQRILSNIIDGLQKNSEKIANLISLEAGKCIKHATAEVSRAITTFSLAKDELTRESGSILPLDIVDANKGRTGLVKYFPIGVVVGITPFNFPLNLVAHKVAPAIAAGCPIIIKPATQTPLASLELANIIKESGLDDKLFSVVTCKGSDMELAMRSAKVKKISFTGSPEVGYMIKEKAYDKKVTLELGGNAAAIVSNLDDIDDVVKRSVSGGFAYQEQVCIHLQRIYIQEDHYDNFKTKFIDETKRLVLGSQQDINVDIGPMIDSGEADRVISWIEEAKRNGASILVGGEREGNIVTPTIIENCDHEEKVNSLEVFGPVVVLHKYKKFKDAVDLVNDSKYGLQAGVFTNDMREIMYAFDNLEVGGVVVNDVPTFRSDNQPYGGVKQSGSGREGVKYAIEEMSELKILSLTNYQL